MAACSIVMMVYGGLMPQIVKWSQFKVLFAPHQYPPFLSSFLSQVVAIVFYSSEILGNIIITTILVWSL
jgi:hypothetical protein